MAGRQGSRGYARWVAVGEGRNSLSCAAGYSWPDQVTRGGAPRRRGGRGSVHAELPRRGTWAIVVSGVGAPSGGRGRGSVHAEFPWRGTWRDCCVGCWAGDGSAYFRACRRKPATCSHCPIVSRMPRMRLPLCHYGWPISTVGIWRRAQIQVATGNTDFGLDFLPPTTGFEVCSYARASPPVALHPYCNEALRGTIDGWLRPSADAELPAIGGCVPLYRIGR